MSTESPLRSPSGLSYDVFIAFSHEDHPWVHGFLIPELGIPRERVCTEQNFRLGGRRIEETERAVQHSRYTVLVLRPALLADANLDLLDQMATQLGLENGAGRLIIVVRAPQPLHPHRLPGERAR